MQKVFLSYYHGDAEEVASFVDVFGAAFRSSLSIGVSDGDGLSAVTDERELMRRIREKYIADSTATVVLIGATTWARRSVDWEIAATASDADRPRKLLGVVLPSAGNAFRLPMRMSGDSVRQVVRPYPTSVGELGDWLANAPEVGWAVDIGGFSALMRRDESLA